MSIQFTGIDISLTAGESLASHQYCFVHQETDGTATLMDNDTEFPVGILQNAPASGELAVVRISGTSKLRMNAALAVGSRIKTEYVNATDCGKGQTAVTDANIMRAITLQASGAEDDVVAVLLCVDKLAIVSSISASPSTSISASPSVSVSSSPSASVSSSPSASPSASVSSSPS